MRAYLKKETGTCRGLIVYLIVIVLVVLGLRAFSPGHQSILKNRVHEINQMIDVLEEKTDQFKKLAD